MEGEKATAAALPTDETLHCSFLDFAGRWVVVTGASSGIGRAIAIELARHRANVVLVGRDVDRLAETASQLPRCEHRTLILDLASHDELAAAIQELRRDTGPLYGLCHAAGVVDTKPGFNNEWYTGLDSGRYATWLTAGWGPVFLTSFAKTSAGQWRAADLPQWDASKFATGNWGGSTLAVMKATQHLPEAAELAVWLTTNPEATKLYTTKQFLFPCTTALLTSAEFAGQKMDFYGGQEVNKVFAKSAAAVSNFEWSPFQDFLFQSMEDEFGASLSGNGTLSDAFDRIQAAVVTYAKEQGFTVV